MRRLLAFSLLALASVATAQVERGSLSLARGDRGRARARPGQGVEHGDRGAADPAPEYEPATGSARSQSSTTSSRSRRPRMCSATTSPTCGATPHNPRGLWRIRSLAVLRRRQAAMADADRRRRAREGRRARAGSGTAPTASRPTIAAAWSRSAPAAPTPTSSANSTSAPARFVDGGFTLPEAKSSSSWVDRDTSARRHRLRAGEPDHLGLSAHRQAVEARHAARSGADDLRGRSTTTSARYSRGVQTATRAGRSSTASKTIWTGERACWSAATGRSCRRRLPETADIEDVIGGRLIVKLQSRSGDLPAGAAGRLFAGRHRGRPADRAASW